MKLKIDLGKCIKAGECYYNHPDLVQMGDDGYPVIQVDRLDTDTLKREADEAMEVCPAQAISVED